MSNRSIATLLCGGLLLAATTSAFAGDPVPGLDVKVGKNPGGQVVATSQTNSQGVATFTNVPPGDYRVSVAAPANKAIRSTVRIGGQASKMASSLNGSATTTFTLRATSSVQVSVEDTGGPAERPEKK